MVHVPEFNFVLLLHSIPFHFLILMIVCLFCRFQDLFPPQELYSVHPIIEGKTSLCNEWETDESIIQLLSDNTEHFKSAIMTINNILIKIETKYAEKKVWLRDYVEQIARWAVGPNDVAFFFFVCFA